MGEVLGIELLDHVIIGNDETQYDFRNYFSFVEHGLLR
jgi:DNA repair protein RadC